MANLSKFNYLGSEITFQIGNGEVMANATEMAKAFGKQPIDWLKSQQSSDFLNALTKLRNVSLDELLTVVRGGSNPGTWMHEDVAMEFSRWLAPEFAIWCNDHIKQMIRTGQTSMGSISEDQKILDALRILQQRVETTTRQLEIANKVITHQAPKVEYYDEVLDSKDLISTTIIAKDLGMSASALNRKLHQMGVIFRQGETWVPYSKYQDKGYCKSKTFPYTDADGKQKTSIHFYWTQAGRKAIFNAFKKHETA